MSRKNEEQKKQDEKEDKELTNEQVEEIFNILDEDYGISCLLGDEEEIKEFKIKIREVRGNLEILRNYIEDELF